MVTPPSRLRSRMLYVATSLALTLGARAEADVTLRLSQPAYEVGEIVSFTLANETDGVIILPHLTWWRIEDSQGALVGGCMVLPLERELYPGYSLTDHWDQLFCPDGPQVPQGRYRLEAPYRGEGCPEACSVAAYFDIGMVAVQPTSWGRIKAVFRER